MFAVVVVAILASTAIGAAPPPAGTSVGDSPAPSGVFASGESGAPAAPAPTPLVDPALVGFLRQLNDKLGASGDQLEAELAREMLRVDDVQTQIRTIYGLVGFASEAVSALDGALGPNQAGGKMAALYGSIADSANETLNASLRFEEEYQVGARELVGLIAQLPALQAELDALALPPSPSPPPSTAPPSTAPPSASPSPSSALPSATPAPSRSIAPSATPVRSPPATPVANEMIENGGFEDGVQAPWGLYLGQDANASVVQDRSTPDSGAASARIDIVAGSPAHSGISLRQAGLELEGGRLYTLNVSFRASSAREVRIRIASPSGASWVNRLEQATTTWRTVSYPFLAGIGGSAELQLDMGRADATTWFDSVSFYLVGG
jgi:hypothetical protein